MSAPIKQDNAQVRRELGWDMVQHHQRPSQVYGPGTCERCGQQFERIEAHHNCIKKQESSNGQ